MIFPAKVHTRADMHADASGERNTAEHEPEGQLPGQRRDGEFLRPAQNGTAEFDSMEHFKRELTDYPDYHNNSRIKARLKGLPPAIHRQQALSAA